MAPDWITENLPARDFDETPGLYDKRGFICHYLDENWNGAYIRAEKLGRLHIACSTTDLRCNSNGRPVDRKMIGRPGQPQFFPVIDCNGSLLRCIDNGSICREH